MQQVCSITLYFSPIDCIPKRPASSKPFGQAWPWWFLGNTRLMFIPIYSHHIPWKTFLLWRFPEFYNRRYVLKIRILKKKCSNISTNQLSMTTIKLKLSQKCDSTSNNCVSLNIHISIVHVASSNAKSIPNSILDYTLYLSNFMVNGEYQRYLNTYTSLWQYQDSCFTVHVNII